jgi:hypothetical protein
VGRARVRAQAQARASDVVGARVSV